MLDTMHAAKAERVLIREELGQLRHDMQTNTQQTARLAGQLINDTLEVYSGAFDSTAQFTRQYKVAIGAVEVTNLGAAAASAVNKQASNTFSAAASGSVGLSNGDQITGFVVSFQSGTSVSGVITVTNVAGGTMSYSITVPAGGGQFSFLFPNPIPAASAVVAPTVNVPAMATGPAYSVDVYGQTVTAAGVTLVVSTDAPSPSGGSPTGTGTYLVPPGTTKTIAIASRRITLYGATGQQFTLQSFTAGVRPVTQ